MMSTKLIVIDTNDNLRNAMKIMKKNDISRLLVKRKDDIVGIITERDISDRMGRLEDRPISDAHLHVSSAYSDKLKTIDQEAHINEAANAMRSEKISSLAVTDTSGKIIGIITKTDLIKSLENSSAPVSEFMTRKIVSLKQGSSLLNARRLMLDNDIKRILVTFEDEIVGVITEGDIANFLGMFRKVSKGIQWFNKLREINVDDVMSKDVIIIGMNNAVSDAVKIMIKNDIAGLPVVDNNDKLVGLLTKTDLIKSI